MNRLIAAAAAVLLAVCAFFPASAHAEEWRWCAVVDHNQSGLPFGPFMVTYPFRVDDAPDYAALYEDYTRSIMGTIRGEFLLNCSNASPSREAAMADRGNWFESISGLPLETMDMDWSPNGGVGGAGGADPRDDYDSTGAAGGRAFCMLQDNVDGQPRAMFSQVFSPPELQSDYDAGMARSFIDYARNMHGARPDATATCHRYDTQAGAHDMRNHEAEMRRIQDWTVVMTLWSH